MHHPRSIWLTLGFATSLLLWTIIAITPATAASVTYKFSGIVTSADGDLAPTFSTSPTTSKNTTMTGSLTYNDSPLDTPPAVDIYPPGDIGMYNGVITDLTIVFNDGYMATLKSTGSISNFIL